MIMEKRKEKEEWQEREATMSFEGCEKRRGCRLGIKAAMELRGLKPGKVAERLGISGSALRQQMSGDPRLSSLQRIAAAIGCEVRELLV